MVAVSWRIPNGPSFKLMLWQAAECDCETPIAPVLADRLGEFCARLEDELGMAESFGAERRTSERSERRGPVDERRDFELRTSFVAFFSISRITRRSRSSAKLLIAESEGYSSYFEILDDEIPSE